jgi:4-amino-4-deoxy-L-arabinose transferase-like glycosyltransferase
LLSDKQSDEACRSELLLLAIVSLAILCLGLHTLAYPFRRDHGEFAATAQVLLDGGVPYRDVWNPKPPAILYLWTAILALAGPSMVAARWLDLLAVLLAAVLLTSLRRQLWGTLGGLVTGVSYAALYFANLPGDLAQHGGLMTAVVVVSAVCFWRPQRGSRSIWMAAAGLAGGVVIAFKYPIGLWLLFLGGWLLVEGGVGTRERLKRLLLLARGSLVAWVFLLGLLGNQMALGDFLESIRVTSGCSRLWVGWRLPLLLLGALAFYFVGQQFGAMALAVGSLFVRPRAGEC